MGRGYRSSRRRYCSAQLVLAALALVLLSAWAFVSRIPWRHEQRIYIPRALLPRALPVSSAVPSEPPLWPFDQQRRCPRTRLEMLQLFTRWLDGHGVSYFLTYGTLLGSVREGAIIPYTTDVDIAVPALWMGSVQSLLETQLPRCLETGEEGPNRMVFHIYSRSDDVERLHAVSPLLPFAKAEPWLDVYNVEMCSPGHASTEGVPPNMQEAGSPCEEIVATGAREAGVEYVYLTGLNGAAANSRKDEGDGSSGYVPHLLYDDIFPINRSGAIVGGEAFASPHRPQALLDVVYGSSWRVARDYS